jgi:hypothetical protein
LALDLAAVAEAERFAGALRVFLALDLAAVAEAERFAGALREGAEAARFAGALREGAAEIRFEVRLAGAFRVEPEDLDAAEALRVAGFFLAELERTELDFERLLGFLGVAMAADYSEGPRIRRRFSLAESERAARRPPH